MQRKIWGLSMTHFLNRFSLNKALWSSALSAAVLAVSLGPSYAQTGPEEDVVIVTGSLRVNSGGAQDIKHFRGGVKSGVVPRPHGMTSEGLLSEHDLYLKSDQKCAQVLCLNSAVKTASFVDADYFAGLGFDTNIAENWTRGPLNMVAVIDRSGSMRRSIQNVKQSLHAISDQLRPGDQISFVLYGSDVVTHLEPLRIAAGAKEKMPRKSTQFSLKARPIWMRASRADMTLLMKPRRILTAQRG